jgi:hypothetical protein
MNITEFIVRYIDNIIKENNLDLVCVVVEKKSDGKVIKICDSLNLIQVCEIRSQLEFNNFLYVNYPDYKAKCVERFVIGVFENPKDLAKPLSYLKEVIKQQASHHKAYCLLK